MRFILSLMSMLALMVGLAYTASAQTSYMKLFSDEERTKPYIEAHSYTMPHNFVDGQWEGIIAASDGKTYFSFSSHSPNQNGQFYSFDPRTKQVTHIIDVAEWCGEKDAVGKYNTQGKIHSTIFETNGKLYCTSTTAHRPLDHPLKGGHFLSYDLKTGKCADLGCFPDDAGGLLTALYEPVYKRLYAISQTNQLLCYYDLTTRKIVNLGSIEDNPMQCRTLIADEYGNIYGSTWGHRIYKFNPKTNEMSCLLTTLPFDPNIPQPAPDPTSQAWMTTHWVPMVWDPVTKWWYGIKGADEYLFRFRSPAPGSHRAQVEGLASMSFQKEPTVGRFASLAMVRKDRTLYYCSYPTWRSMAHLMSYNIDTKKVTDHGPIVTDGNRRVSEIHSLVVGSDGKLHAAAMVWSIEGQDPANEWAERAYCYFHSRFLVIDPEQDFKNQELLK